MEPPPSREKALAGRGRARAGGDARHARSKAERVADVQVHGGAARSEELHHLELDERASARRDRDHGPQAEGGKAQAGLPPGVELGALVRDVIALVLVERDLQLAIDLGDTSAEDDVRAKPS